MDATGAANAARHGAVFADRGGVRHHRGAVGRVRGLEVPRFGGRRGRRAQAPIARSESSLAGSTQSARATHKPRVLLMGDSVMDQQGNHAAFELRQAGVDARVVGFWGSSLLSRDQYDYGRTIPNGLWLARAAQEVATFNPEVVAVYLNHNYWPPFPRDAAGNT